MSGLRVLVHLNNLALGGAQLNAVDIARTLRDRGHHPVLFAQGVEGPPRWSSSPPGTACSWWSRAGRTPRPGWSGRG